MEVVKVISKAVWWVKKLKEHMTLNAIARYVKEPVMYVHVESATICRFDQYSCGTHHTTNEQGIMWYIVRRYKGGAVNTSLTLQRDQRTDSDFFLYIHWINRSSHLWTCQFAYRNINYLSWRIHYLANGGGGFIYLRRYDSHSMHCYWIHII